MAKGIESSGPPDVTSYVDDLESRLTAVRAGYLDNLSGGAGALQASVDDLEAAVGAIEGATALHNKLTAARAALLDQITAVRLAELNAANLPADIDSLLARLTALRAGYLDELDFDLNARLGIPAGASLAADLLVIDNFVDDLEGAVGAIEGVTTLHNKLTAARAALLDQITAIRLAELDAANIPADIDSLKTLAAATVAGRVQMAATTIDLNQVAATYDLFTGTSQVVILEGLSIKMPTGAAGGALTSISIQTDDVTNQVIISAADGAVANLTSEAELSWTGFVRITVATKIRLTIAGGAHGSAYVCNVVASCRAVVAGGYLA